ncbi:hypothetical protein TRVL_02571 [Trypanosoma vivax]|nr:hypothetical protein TRVL_02571 [Trypanosoma vivax]
MCSQSHNAASLPRLSESLLHQALGLFLFRPCIGFRAFLLLLRCTRQSTVSAVRRQKVSSARMYSRASTANAQHVKYSSFTPGPCEPRSSNASLFVSYDGHFSRPPHRSSAARMSGLRRRTSVLPFVRPE